MTDYISAAEYGQQLSPPISSRRVRVLCGEGRVKGARRIGGMWIVPAGSPDPRKWSREVEAPITQL